MLVDALSEKHQRFVRTYIECLHQGRAYKAAFPHVMIETARTEGCKLANQTEVKAAIYELLKAYIPAKEETLQRIIKIVEFDLGQYFIGDILQLDQLIENGYGWMVKGVKQTKFGTEVVLMDKDTALNNLAKIQTLFNDTQQITINIGQEISAKDQLTKKLQDLDDKFASSGVNVK